MAEPHTGGLLRAMLPKKIISRLSPNIGWNDHLAVAGAI